MAAKKKTRKKKKHITNDQVIQLRERAAIGVTDQDLAEDYGLSMTGVYLIRSGRSRTRVGGPITKGKRAVPTANTITVPQAVQKAKKPGHRAKGAQPRSARRRAASGDFGMLSRLAANAKHIVDAWYEIKAAQAIIDQRIKDIEEMING